MKKAFIYFIAPSVASCIPFISMAHAGHGHGNPLAPDHYIANPEHALPILLTLAASLAFAWYIKKRVVRAKE